MAQSPTVFSNSLQTANLLQRTNLLEFVATSGFHNDLQVANGLMSPFETPQVTPTFSPVAGSYTGAQAVTISSSGATAIYYTTDGSTPTIASPQYFLPIVVSSSETIEAIAVQSGYLTSAVGSAAYTITALGSQTIVRDTYSRGNSGTLGANWTALSGAFDTAVIGITSNSARVQSTGGWSCSFWNTNPCTPNQYSEVIAGANTLTSLGSQFYLEGVAVRCSSPDSHYGFTWELADGGEFASNLQLILVNAGAAYSLALSASSIPVIGCLMRLEVIGSTLNAYINGNLVLTATDTTLTSGQPGIKIYQDPAAVITPELTNWGGGNLIWTRQGTAIPVLPSNQLATYAFTTIENPLSDGGKFTAASSGLSEPKVLSSGVCEPTTTDTAQGGFYTGYGTWPSSQYSEVKILALGSGSFAAPIVLESGGTGNGTCYFFNLAGPTGSSVNSVLYASINGTVHNIGNVNLTVSVGDVIRVSVGVAGSANVVTVSQNGNIVLTVVDTTYNGSIASGTPGFYLYAHSALTNAQISSWAGGLAFTQGGTEEPSVIYESSPQILSANPDGKIFKMWYTNGWAPQNTYPLAINYAESSDGISWTQYSGNPVISNGSTPVAHGYVLHYGSTYYAYYGNTSAASLALDLWTSSDGITWSLTHPAVLPVGSSGAWDQNSVDNPNVWVNSGTWYMLYTGLTGVEGAGGTYQVGLATSPDGINWTKYASNPVITATSGGTTANGKALLQVAGTYYLWGFVTPSSGSSTNLPTDIAIWSSPDLHIWTPSSKNPVYERVLVDEGVNLVGGQVGDPCLVLIPANTFSAGSPAVDTVYMYYDTITTQAANKMHINVATVPNTVLQLALMEMTANP